MKMKKLQEIDRLVEEALKELQSADVKIEVRKILNKLARKCAEINEEDFDYYSRKILYYNSRLRDGQVETPEQKQEEKPALQPLPEEVPKWFMHISSKGVRTSIWNQLRYYYGTQREWWMDLKKGDHFYNTSKKVVTFNGFIEMNQGVWLGCIEIPQTSYLADSCSPYTDPAKSFRLKLTPEMQVEFDKLMEGRVNE